jgi:hypothetical protein
MFVLLSLGLREVRGPNSGVVMRGIVVDDEEREFGDNVVSILGS